MEKIDPRSCDDCPVMQLWRILPARNHPNDDNDDDDIDDNDDDDEDEDEVQLTIQMGPRWRARMTITAVFQWPREAKT